jgi:hypothetical protein
VTPGPAIHFERNLKPAGVRQQDTVVLGSQIPAQRQSGKQDDPARANHTPERLKLFICGT